MRHHWQMRVRFRDTDALGHVNNATYFTYIEEARCQLVREMGLSGPLIPLLLVAVKAEYRAQTFHGELLDIESWVTRIGRASFDMHQRIVRQGDGREVFCADAVMVYYNHETQKSARIPDNLRAFLQTYMEAPAERTT
ncbi:MAG: acyl-CoA thioesterase [Alicyclobacillus sp.]|nr:acyl-CoA thioesterase [Alicyclobacillus sp.]